MMGNNDSLDDLYNLDKMFNDLLEKFPNTRRELVEECGQKMYEKVISNIKSTVKENTGDLINGVEKVVGSKGGYSAVRPNWLKAPHTHLIENGHRAIVGKRLTASDKRRGVENSQKFVRWVPGKHMYRNALNELADELEQEAEKMINDLVGDIFD